MKSFKDIIIVCVDRRMIFSSDIRTRSPKENYACHWAWSKESPLYKTGLGNDPITPISAPRWFLNRFLDSELLPPCPLEAVAPWDASLLPRQPQQYLP